MEVDLNELERLAKAATPGPWDLEPIRSEGCYGSGPNCSTGFDSYEIRADGSVLLDALNSDAALVSEDWDGGALYAWDEIGQRNLSFIAAANPAVVLELVRRLREAEGRVARAVEAERSDAPRGNASGTLELILTADSGYISSERHRISPEQWGKIQAALKNESPRGEG